MKCMKLHYAGEVYPLTDMTNWCITTSISGNQSVSFDISPESDVYKYIEEETRLEYESVYYTVKSINERTAVSGITAELDLDELNATVFQSFITETESLYQTLTKALANTGWTINGAGLISVRRSLELTDVTPLDIVNKCTEKTVFNVSFSIDNKNRTLNVCVPSAGVNHVFFSDQLNLKSLNFKGSSQEIVTRLYAYGKDGLSVASVNGGKEYIDNHTYSDKIICKVWRDERYTNPSNLLADAVAKLNETAVPERSYVCEVIDLAKLAPEKYADFTVRVNSIIVLIDRRRNKRLEYTVVEMKEYPNEPKNNVITLSTTPQKISKKLKTNSIQLDSIQETVNAQPSFWEQAILNATALITGVENSIVVLNPSENPQEILFLDTPDINTAVNILRINRNGIGFSNNGYSGPYTTAMTIDGSIVANCITSGTMQAERIRGGILEGVRIIAQIGSIAGWNMQNGVLVSSDGTLKFDSINNTVTVYDTSGQQLMSLNKNGIRFWRDNKEIGNIGVTKGADTDTYGITFNLVDGDAMTWSVLDKVNNVYVNKVRYTEQDGLTISNNVSCSSFNGYRLMRNTWTFADGQTMKYWGWED